MHITSHCTAKITPISSKLLVSGSMDWASENTSPFNTSFWSTAYRNSCFLSTAILPTEIRWNDAPCHPIPNLHPYSAKHLLFFLMVLIDGHDHTQLSFIWITPSPTFDQTHKHSFNKHLLSTSYVLKFWSTKSNRNFVCVVEGEVSIKEIYFRVETFSEVKSQIHKSMANSRCCEEHSLRGWWVLCGRMARLRTGMKGLLDHHEEFVF